MHEYATVSSSSYDPASLAAKLTEKSGQGWNVVAIVPTGGDITAFLSREADGSDEPSKAAATPEASPAIAGEVIAVVPAPEPVSEPAGWAVAPEPTPAEPAAPVAAEPIPVIDEQTSDVPPAEPQPVVAAAPSPAVPAGWYADPAGRFELRYWDGGTWTEHVSRAGQQFTDPPVA
jgi:hypothetical protein